MTEERTRKGKRSLVENSSFQNVFFFISVALRCRMSEDFQSTIPSSSYTNVVWETINDQSFLTHISLDEVLSCLLTEFRVHIRTSISNVVL